MKTFLEARSSREETSIRIYKDEKKVNDFENLKFDGQVTYSYSSRHFRGLRFESEIKKIFEL